MKKTEGTQLDFYILPPQFPLHFLLNSRSYRNRGTGLLTWSAQSLILNHGYFADNGVGLSSGASDNLEINNSIFKGLTPLTIRATASTAWKLCINSYPPKGMELNTALHRGWFSQLGTSLSNVTFDNFSFSEDCSDSVPISFNGWVTDRHMNALLSLSEIFTDDKTRMLNMCHFRDVVGVDDIIITELQGALDPGVATKASAIVSLTEKMTTFANCIEYPTMCFAYCE